MCGGYAFRLGGSVGMLLEPVNRFLDRLPWWARWPLFVAAIAPAVLYVAWIGPRAAELAAADRVRVAAEGVPVDATITRSWHDRRAKGVDDGYVNWRLAFDLDGNTHEVHATCNRMPACPALGEGIRLLVDPDDPRKAVTVHGDFSEAMFAEEPAALLAALFLAGFLGLAVVLSRVKRAVTRGPGATSAARRSGPAGRSPGRAAA